MEISNEPFTCSDFGFPGSVFEVWMILAGKTEDVVINNISVCVSHKMRSWVEGLLGNHVLFCVWDFVTERERARWIDFLDSEN